MGKELLISSGLLLTLRLAQGYLRLRLVIALWLKMKVIFLWGTMLLSYHSWAARDLSPTTVLSTYITLWLKRCIVPSLPREGILVRVLYPAIQLVCGFPLGLLLAMICRLQHGLRLIFEAFLNEPNPNPCIDLPYTYLMARFISYSQGLIPTAPATLDSENFLPM